jgi:hypothetical protein
MIGVPPLFLDYCILSLGSARVNKLGARGCTVLHAVRPQKSSYPTAAFLVALDSQSPGVVPENPELCKQLVVGYTFLDQYHTPTMMRLPLI